MRIIRLNGRIVTNPVDGLQKEGFSESRKSDTGYIGRKYNKELIFFNEEFEEIKRELFDDPYGGLKTIDVEIYDDCCPDENGEPFFVFKGEILGKNVEYCKGDCQISATVTEKTPKKNCFQRTLIWKNDNGFLNKDHPKVYYCNEVRPAFVQHLLIIFGLSLLALSVALVPIVAIVSVTIRLVCAIPGVKCKDSLKDGVLDDYLMLIKNIPRFIVGCGRHHPSPKLRDYIQNACDICGLKFSSSILNNPASDYHNIMYFNAPNEKGSLKTSTKIIEANLPLENGKALMDKITPVFNADYDIENDTLYFERADKLITDEWIDYEFIESESRIVEPICYKWRDKPLYAYANLQYADDASDTIGSEALNRFNEVIEWNNPVNEYMKDAYDVNLQFGAARFRDDEIDEDILDKYRNFPVIGRVIKKYDKTLLLDKDIATFSKLLIWDGVDINNAKIKRTGGSFFNYAMSFGDYNVNQDYEPNHPNGNLANRFHSIENPRRANGVTREFEFKFIYNCDELKRMSAKKTVTLPKGVKGRIDDIDVDLNGSVMTVKGYTL